MGLEVAHSGSSHHTPSVELSGSMLLGPFDIHNEGTCVTHQRFSTHSALAAAPSLKFAGFIGQSPLLVIELRANLNQCYTEVAAGEESGGH